MSNDTDDGVQEPQEFVCRSCSTPTTSVPPRPKGWRSVAVKPLVGAVETIRFEVCNTCLGAYDLSAIIERCSGLKQGDGDAD